VRGEVEYRLEDIVHWRAGHHASPGLSADSERYALRMRLAIRAHEKRLIELGHEGTTEYVQKHGFCDGAFPV
jgi:hypothetical protein